MKTLLLSLSILLTSQTSFAGLKGWTCMTTNPEDTATLKALKLPGYLSEIQVLTVDPKLCGRIGPAIYQDFCAIKGNTLGIGIDAVESEFYARTGEKLILICEKNRIVYPQH
ncbi:MAG TPA: hypothetical protein VNJ01_00700 [Bacteriovoracaceae bacterium]|nr:hypothetical protein [Bacteriovoracaceae bacterium]